MKKRIDLAEGTKFFDGDETGARKMLEYLVAMFPEVREELNNAYYERELSPIKFRFMVHKFYGGLLYVGVPALRQAVSDLLTALNKKEESTINQLYQTVLDEMQVLQVEVAKMV
jgi:HPt (histidine-containing phosphotransfer) domain-containing protein